MIVKENTDILLFRFSNYRNNSFLLSLEEILQQKGYVWVLKSGRKSDNKKILQILEQGGWFVLKEPKSDGGKYFISKFDEYTEDIPDDKNFPGYYNDIISENGFQGQWFKLTLIKELSNKDVLNLKIAKTEKSVIEVIQNTRTAVMFTKNKSIIKII